MIWGEWRLPRVPTFTALLLALTPQATLECPAVEMLAGPVLSWVPI